MKSQKKGPFIYRKIQTDMKKVQTLPWTDFKAKNLIFGFVQKRVLLYDSTMSLTVTYRKPTFLVTERTEHTQSNVNTNK